MPSTSWSITRWPTALEPKSPVDTQAAARRELLATLLVVEPDPLVRELLTASLEIHQPAWRVESVANAARAASRLAAPPQPDLLILDLALPEPSRGVELVRQVRRRAQRLPVLLLTAAPEQAWRQGLDVDAMLVKPPDMGLLLPRVERLLALHRGSVVRGIALATLLQMIEAEQKSCTLTVAAGGESGRLWVRGGRLVAADTRERQGREAFFEMLEWPAPVVEVVDRCERPAGGGQGLQELLLEHAIAKDHRR